MTLTELRQSKQVGVREAARRMKTKHPAIIRFERSGNATIRTLEAYASALGVEAEQVRKAAEETRTSCPIAS